ncbi:serine/threonine-protein phosphatase [Edaphobacter sp. HDX4]|uniref:PP2C family protein-serine/threonine phosphatase n=1 Tax=Edaphobacter sp. HDX4 TaxID=2794064 RepID=UPI002FE67890
MPLPMWLQWDRRFSQKWQYYRDVPFSRLWSLYAAVFSLFAITGFFGDLVNLGRTPYVIAILNAIFSGLVAIMYLHVGIRLTPNYFVLATVIQIPLWIGFSGAASFLTAHFHLQPVSTSSGIRVAAIITIGLVMVSYSLFVRFLRGEGQEAFRLRNELELAHGIQKTLVPPIAISTAGFEVYGQSNPSDKVGGDLVDAVTLADRTTLAYLADIAGHGLQAGILMGMVKTAARTALLDGHSYCSKEVLCSLMEQLNRVLPGVKESQMYATLAAFSLDPAGTVFYALAGHPPFLHYRSRRCIDRVSSEQYPIGLLPVTGFTAEAVQVAPGDLLVVVTDGIFETCSRKGEDFGYSRLEELVSTLSTAELPVLANAILDAVNHFGRQQDDQTLLLIRRL